MIRRRLTAASVFMCLAAGVPGSLSAGQVAAGVTIHGPAPPEPPAVASRDESGGLTLRAIRLDEPLVVDGRLDEEIYRRVPSVSDFIQQEPIEGAPATERTEIWVFFDGQHVYISARCWDSEPDRMVATEMRRDHGGIFQNENFSIVLDTFYDRRNGFLFQTNPLGGLRDGLVTDERNNNRDWDGVWNVRTARFEQGWTIEMAIPFKSLRYRGTGPQVWGFNVLRLVRWKNELSYLTPIPASYGVTGIFKFSSAATLVGIEPPSQALNLEVKPYAISSLTASRLASPPLANDLSGDAGVDLKYGLAGGLTLDLTYNTDFAQVEDDEQQVNLTRFSLFFPEKRDFFLEGQGVFAIGAAQRSSTAASTSDIPLLFFSRRIGLSAGQAVPIHAGGRLTGRTGAYSIGALNIQTADAPALGAAATNWSVVRLRRDILRRSAVGIIGTRHAPSGRDASQVGGIDLNLAFFENLTLGGYYAASGGGPGTSGDRSSYHAVASFLPDRYGLQVEHVKVGADFNPEIGFVRRSDFRRSSAQARFSPRPQGIPAVRKLHWEGSFDYVTNGAGRVETREAQGVFRVDLENGDSWTAEHADVFEYLDAPFAIARGVTIPAGDYRFGSTRTIYRLGPQRGVSGSFSASHGRFFGGRRTGGSYSGRVEISPRLTLEPRFSIDHVDLPGGRFTTRLLSNRTSLTFSPRVAATVLVQYNSSNGTLGANMRFRWEYRPGSDLYIVYSEGRDTLDPRTALDNRTFVVKLTRLFRY